jgi:hypothetical protein
VFFGTRQDYLQSESGRAFTDLEGGAAE